ncbi:MAG: phosphoribosylamine--glycine ligase [Myxococcales bacterium]|nr:phosphoribosylamine--glycine ligase [Myxococcales bacterium]
MAKILVVGSGAREHALAVALAGHDILTAPGNAGTLSVGRNADVAATDVPGLVALAERERVDLVVVGPELPLTLGLVDALEARGIAAFGPSKRAAELEGSKVFMKRFAKRHGIPTAAFEVFDDPAEAKAFIRREARPLVVKADGLCAGKGVVVATSVDEAVAAVDRMMVDRAFGDAGARVVIEDLLPGEEASFHVVTDGTRAVALVPAQDHKRLSDGDRGPNTGGMGAYAPAPVVTPEVARRVMDEIVAPTLAGMRAEGAPLRGALFAGLMIEDGTPRLLEFNVRFGDPETSVLVPMLDGDWHALLSGAARGDLSQVHVGTRNGACLAVVLAAAGYPASPRTGDVISGLPSALADGTFVFHAGTARSGDAVVTAGGRVLAVGARATDLAAARALAYEVVSQISFDGAQHRTDIGHRALG